MYKPCFDLAFIIHYISGETIHGIWNSNEGIYKGQKYPFYQLTELAPVSSIEIVYKDRRSNSINRSVLSIPITDKKLRYIMIHRGLYSQGFGQITQQQIASYENNGIKNPNYLVIPGAIQITLAALEVNDNIERTPLEAYKSYPIVAKLTVDSFGIFLRGINDTSI